MTLIELVQEVCAAVGLRLPSAVVSSTDDTMRQLLVLANREGRELSSRYGWQVLTAEATFTTVAQEDQGAISTLAPGFRYIVNDTIWNRTQSEIVGGPLSPRTWQGLKAETVSGPWPEYRLRGDRLLFQPAPAAGQTCAFEYVTRYWVVDTLGSTYREKFAADTDVIRLDAELMSLGLEWRWRRAKGFDYAEEYATYERMVADAMARDGTKPTLNLGEVTTERRVVAPEGSWPL